VIPNNASCDLTVIGKRERPGIVRAMKSLGTPAPLEWRAHRFPCAPPVASSAVTPEATMDIPLDRHADGRKPAFAPLPHDSRKSGAQMPAFVAPHGFPGPNVGSHATRPHGPRDAIRPDRHGPLPATPAAP